MPALKKKPLASVRKEPVQERSRRTVQAILQATAQVLVRLGYEKTTTGAVAECAGVSIGTLYQYFPNKEMLVAGVIDDHYREVLATVEAVLLDHVKSPLDVSLRALIRASLDAHRLRPELHKVLMEQVPGVGESAQVLELREKLTSLLQQHLARQLGRMSSSRLRMLAFVIETTIEALTHRAVIDTPDWLNSGELETEAFALLAPYIKQALEKLPRRNRDTVPDEQ